MSKNTLYDKVWDKHKVTTLNNDQDQLFIGLHLIHEVTSPQAFATLDERKATVAFPNRTIATVDHIIPTDHSSRPFQDPQAEIMIKELEKNIKKHQIKFFNRATHKQGIVHVIGPELGLTQPGMTIACGDSHTSTHGAFGALAFGIGTSQVAYVLETQTLALNRLKVRRIDINGKLQKGVYAKDIILKIIHDLGVHGGIGYAYEYNGTACKHLSIEERLTICNMSIEGGARIGYFNPDQITYDYLKNKEFIPKGDDYQNRHQYWESIKSEPHANYDDTVTININHLTPMITWGITPDQSIEIDNKLPTIKSFPKENQPLIKKAYDYMHLKENTSIKGTKIDIAFIGSCTNSRLSDLKQASQILKGKKVNPKIRTLVVPGSQQVKKQAEEAGYADIFIKAGCEWRDSGCSMCLAMNLDKLTGTQLCASTSNRNFIGRQGSPTGRTMLMSPAMVAAAAITGEITDVRTIQ